MKTTILDDNQTSISEAISKKISDLDAIVALAAEKIRERSIEQKWTFGEWVEDWDDGYRAYVPMFAEETALFDNDTDDCDGFGFWVELRLTEKNDFKSAEVDEFSVYFDNGEAYVCYTKEEQEYMKNRLNSELYKFYN